MIKYLLAASNVTLGNWSITGEDNRYFVVPKKYPKYNGFLLYKNGDVIFDMGLDALLLGGYRYESFGDNGRNNWGITHEYSSSTISIEIERSRPIPFITNYVYGYINKQRMFLARCKNRKSIKFSGSSLLINRLRTPEAVVAMAYLSAYVLHTDLCLKRY